MTNRTPVVPRPGAGVRFGIPNTPACSNRTANLTPPEREPNSEPNRGEPNTPHAHEPNTRRPVLILEAACRCRLPAADHVCQACGCLFDHADLVHVVGGFRCRIPCHVPAIAERFAWPTVTRCTACAAAVAKSEGKRG